MFVLSVTAAVIFISNESVEFPTFPADQIYQETRNVIAAVAFEM